MASASTSYRIGNNYSQFDVFVNHRGPDVKEGFASHLYHRLLAHGLRVFLDCKELQGGDNLTPQIEGAIKTSSVHIAIFSPRYAESIWCLKELLLMLESGSTILPVFYNVHPSELRWTRGGDGVYARSLRMLKEKKDFDSQTHQEKHRYDSGTISEWRMALSDVADISGFELKACNGDEEQLIDKVVQQVLKKVRRTPLNVAKYPTGLDEKVKDVERTAFSQQQSHKARVVGIVGLGGVGKTTLAKEFFNHHRSNYSRSCFVFDVSESAAKSSLKSSQSALLKDLAQLTEKINSIDQGTEMLKKHLSSPHQALIVIDNVDHIDQLDALLFPAKDVLHSGSLILVTSRNKDVLTSAGIVESSMYELKGLHRHHSRELFCSHAFDQLYPVKGFEQLVERFLDACQGLPLSLKVIGALVSGKDLTFWKAQLHKISIFLPEDIRSKLKISYDGLDEEEKQIFLDIACFFIGEDRDTAIRIWDGSGWEGWLGLRNLENRCLVEVDREKRIRMHDHIRDLGRELAQKEHMGCQFRVWSPVNSLLHNLFDQSHVRGISMVHGNFPIQSFEMPTNMQRLQLLRAEGFFVERVFSVDKSLQLIYLRWESCPYSSLPSSIPIKNLRVLYIKGGILETLWQHESQAPLELRELNIDANLLKVPKSIGMLKHLEKIVLHWKISARWYRLDLEALPDEFCHIQSLKHLELKKCHKMTLLPDSFGNLTNLQSIELHGCSNLLMLPNSVGNLTNLQSIDLSECSTLLTLPYTVGKLTNIQRIDLSSCFNLRVLPDSFGKMTNLQRIGLSRCFKLRVLPSSVGQLKNLECIDLRECINLRMLPDSIGELAKLRRIDLSFCFDLRMIPDSVGNLTNLQCINLHGCSHLQMLPASVGKLPNLQLIDLRKCSNLQWRGGMLEVLRKRLKSGLSI